MRLRPEFELSDDLKRAEKKLNAGDFGRGIDELQKVIEKSEDAAVIEEAKTAMASAMEFGNGELASVDNFAEAGYYVEATKKLMALEKMFKGTEIGEKAESKLDAWKKDDTVQAEIDGAELIAQAEALMKDHKYKNAARALARVTKSDKYEGTKVRDKAEKLLQKVMDKL